MTAEAVAAVTVAKVSTEAVDAMDAAVMAVEVAIEVAARSPAEARVSAVVRVERLAVLAELGVVRPEAIFTVVAVLAAMLAVAVVKVRVAVACPELVSAAVMVTVPGVTAAVGAAEPLIEGTTSVSLSAWAMI